MTERTWFNKQFSGYSSAVNQLNYCLYTNNSNDISKDTGEMLVADNVSVGNVVFVDNTLEIATLRGYALAIISVNGLQQVRGSHRLVDYNILDDQAIVKFLVIKENTVAGQYSVKINKLKLDIISH